MYNYTFVFSKILETLSLAFLSVVAVKAIGSLKSREPERDALRRLVWLRSVLYAAVLALAIVGARGIGIESSARFHSVASESEVPQMQLASAYANARRAVELRPGGLRYWQDLSVAKFTLGQFNSVLKDEPVIRALNGGNLDEATALRCSRSHYFLGQYDEVVPLTEGVIQTNRFLGAPYVLEGLTYIAQKKYAQAKQRFLIALQTDPSQLPAVEGLAHAHYLMGDVGNALEVLNDTEKFPFSPEARKRIDDLKAFYAR